MAKLKKTDPEQTEQSAVPDGVICDETVCTLPVDIQDDEHRGVGGSYIFDPATGKRTRIEEPAHETNANVGADSIRPADVTETEKADEI